MPDSRLRVKLRTKKPSGRPTDDSDGDVAPELPILPHRSRTQRRLDKIKADPQKYKEHCESDSKRSKLYRWSLTGEKLDSYNESAKVRMREWRERQKQAAEKTEAQPNLTQNRPLTRAEKEKEDRNAEGKMESHQKGTKRIRRAKRRDGSMRNEESPTMRKTLRCSQVKPQPCQS
jgi:hypothetical protein